MQNNRFRQTGDVCCRFLRLIHVIDVKNPNQTLQHGAPKEEGMDKDVYFCLGGVIFINIIIIYIEACDASRMNIGNNLSYFLTVSNKYNNN